MKLEILTFEKKFFFTY